MIDLAGGELGSEAKWDLDLKGGKLVLSARYAGLGGGADVSVSLDANYFVDELAKKIPGQIDDAIFAVLKAALAAS